MSAGLIPVSTVLLTFLNRGETVAHRRASRCCTPCWRNVARLCLPPAEALAGRGEGECIGRQPARSKGRQNVSDASPSQADEEARLCAAPARHGQTALLWRCE